VAELRDIAGTLRSKNADPFITTCDVFVTNEADYRWLKASNVITADNVAHLYRMPIEAIVGIYFIDNIRAVKVSFFKTSGGKYIASGDLEDLDLVGAQQHVPLLRLPIPDKQEDE
jgi:Domain of unknown function (DUF4387)